MSGTGVGERRTNRRVGVSTVDLVTCPRCGDRRAEVFTDGDEANFRCARCHLRWIVVFGHVMRIE